MTVSNKTGSVWEGIQTSPIEIGGQLKIEGIWGPPPPPGGLQALPFLIVTRIFIGFLRILPQNAVWIRYQAEKAETAKKSSLSLVIRMFRLKPDFPYNFLVFF